jgi:hypothetical protein
MKAKDSFPWFETVAFVLIVLLATVSNLAPQIHVAAAEPAATQSPH